MEKKVNTLIYISIFIYMFIVGVMNIFFGMPITAHNTYVLLSLWILYKI